MDLQTEIEQAFEHYEKLDCQNAQQHLHEVLRQILDHLEVGQFRVAEKINGQWQTHEWLKKAILLCFRMYPNQVIDGQFARFFDKIPLQYRDLEAPQFNDRGIRIVPPACVRRGAYIGQNTVLMPSYVNIGAYVDSGCMIDTWATVGSCAQIGKNVHISGGAGIGGVLEPLQATPTIIEDNCFIGARSEIVEGVIVEQGSVIAMGVFISQSTKIYHRETGEITYGRIPAGSVVVPGSLPAANGHYHLNCAIIVKQVDAKTRAKTSINELLRNSNLC